MMSKSQENVKKSHNVEEKMQKSHKNGTNEQKIGLSLTEQWKNGTLKEGWYYLSIVPSKKCIDYYYGEDFERYNEWAITKVLAPVPTYKEFFEDKKIMKGLGRDYSELMNQKVELLEKIVKLEKQLDIAIKALKEAHTFPRTTTLKDWCQERLKEIDEV